MMSPFTDRIAELCDAAVTAMSPVSGGDFATAFCVDLDDGRRVFAKTHTNPPPGFFSTEAAGLAWLSEVGALPVASVVAVVDDAPACLILDWIELGGQRSEAGEEAFGRGLAALHRSGSLRFGREDGRTTGSQALPNGPCDSWEEFYRERRLLPLAKIASQRRSLSTPAIERLIRVADRLSDFGAADEPAARLHGDLWAGNRVVDVNGESWLIDPAAHGGHREFDLAMMRLFGGFGEPCFQAYDEVYPLAHGWERRVHLHQLAPLVVHAIKFGGGYVGAVDSALDGLSSRAELSTRSTYDFVMEGLEATGIELRPAAPHDADLIWRTLCLASDWASDDTPSHPGDVPDAYFADWGKPDDIGVLAFLGIEFAGGAYLRRVGPADGTYGYFEPDFRELTIGVEHIHRGSGIGRLILEVLKAKAMEEGVAGISLSVETGNTVARALYTSARFAVDQTRETDVLMVWRNPVLGFG